MPRTRIIEGVTKVLSERKAEKPTKDRPFQRVDAALSTQGPLEEQQQEAVIHDFEQMQLQTARQSRAVLGCCTGLLAVFFAWQAWAQLTHPWGQRITGELRAAGADGGVMVVALLFQSLALAACCSAMFQGMPSKGAPHCGCLPASLRQRVLLIGSLVANVGCCGYWLWVHHGMVAKFGDKLGSRTDLLWIPFAPVTLSAVSCWAVSSLGATGRDVAGLKELRYEFKTA